ncbi:hypothetical protein BV898_18804, partial [Hypsibius exemplaris]
FRNHTTMTLPSGALRVGCIRSSMAMEAVKQGSAVVGMKNATHAVVAAVKRTPSELASYQKKFSPSMEHCGVGIAGLTADARKHQHKGPHLSKSTHQRTTMKCKGMFYRCSFPISSHILGETSGRISWSSVRGRILCVMPLRALRDYFGKRSGIEQQTYFRRRRREGHHFKSMTMKWFKNSSPGQPFRPAQSGFALDADLMEDDDTNRPPPPEPGVSVATAWISTDGRRLVTVLRVIWHSLLFR